MTVDNEEKQQNLSVLYKSLSRKTLLQSDALYQVSNLHNTVVSILI